VAALLQDLAIQGDSGVLRISGQGRIWFRDGRIYLVETEHGSGPAEVLFGAGVGSLDELSERLAMPGASVAAELAESHPGSGPVVGRLLHEHNLNGLFELLVPGEMTCTFDDGIAHGLGPAFSEDTLDLIGQAKRRLDIWRQIAGRIPSTAACFRLSPVLPDGGEERLITADEWRYLSLLDGHRSVADVITETGESAFRVCSALYRLLLEGMIEEI
jgi:hypothetical protein